MDFLYLSSAGNLPAIGTHNASIMAAVAVLLSHMDRKAVIAIIPAIKSGMEWPVFEMIFCARSSSIRYLCRAEDRTKPPRNSRIIFEKKGARNTESDIFVPPSRITSSSQALLRNRIIRLVTNSGTASEIQRVALIRRITKATCAGFSIPRAEKAPNIPHRI